MWLWLAACAGDPDLVIGPSVCDGLHQEDDGEWTDAVYDRDGDGFFDGANPDCVLAYGANRLDCDDEDVSVSPVAAEEQCNDVDDDCNPDTPDFVDLDGDGSPACEDCDDDDPAREPGGPDQCFDEIDNNCNSIVDDDCGPDFNGRYALVEPIRYTCSVGLVRIDFEEVVVLFNPPLATMRNEGSGQPGNMDSVLEADGKFEFVAEKSLSSLGSCTEVYTMKGEFDGAGGFQARFTAEYSGFACLNCRDQEWRDVVGFRTGDL
jgi:hypothetical protein